LKKNKDKRTSSRQICKKVAIYPGSFDPLTNGHVNIIYRGLELFDELIVAVAHNTAKKTAFTTEERVEIIRQVFRNEPKVKVESFEGLLVNYATQKKINIILRGLRTVSDFEFEFQMALANRGMRSKIETVFMMTDSSYTHLSSTLIKEIVALGGSGKGMVPPLVERRLREKFGAKK